MRLLSLCCVLVFLPYLAGAAPDAAFVRQAADGLSWTIGNALVEREIRFVPSQGLRTTSWQHLVTGTDFIKPWINEKFPAAEFSFAADGKMLTGAGAAAVFSLVKSDVRDIEPAGKLLEIRLQGRATPVEVSVFHAVYRGHPVVRKWLAITNRGTTPLRISRLSMEELGLRAGPPSEQELSGFYGVAPREIFFTGRVEDTAVVSRNALTGEGFVVMNEAPGWMKRTEMVNWGDGVKVMYDADLFPFERTLAPGKSFTSAASGIAFFKDGEGFADPHWVMPSYTSEVLMKKGAAYQPPWIYNTWEPFFQDLTEAAVRESIPPAARMGMDVVTIDTGWATSYADNEVNRKKFPQGLEEIRDELERQGMRLGLWEPIDIVSPQSRVYREHPEWVMRDGDGKEKSTNFPVEGDRIMCLASPYREAAAERLNDHIRRYHLKYVKLDLITVFSAYGETPGCTARGHYHHNWAESLEMIYEGIQYVTDRIYREHPDVLLDLTFELWGQKHVIDYGLLAAGDLDWLSNVDDSSSTAAGPRQVRTLLYHRALAIPVETMLIGNLRAETPTPEEHFATVIGSAPLFLGDLRKLSEAQLRWYAEKIAWFRKLRREVPIEQSFFPLGAWMQPRASAWDGFARLSRQGEGAIAVFKNQSSIEQVDVKIPSFPEGEFQLRSVMTGKEIGRFSGAEIARGIPVFFPSEFKAEIVEVRKQ